MAPAPHRGRRVDGGELQVANVLVRESGLAVWFRPAEVKFNISGITAQRIRFNHVLVALPKEVINSVTDVIRMAAKTSADPRSNLASSSLSGDRLIFPRNPDSGTNL